MAFHVFVEGATDDTPAGVERLAAAIAKHYGLPAADLLARLSRGRFRVKGNIDRTLADKYCRDLERLGARCIVEEATAENSQRTTPIPFPAVRPATPPVGVPTAPPPRPSAPPSALSGIAPKPAPPPSASAQYQSGLSAAFAPSEAPASLGALDSENVSFSLASVDGADEQAAASAGGFEPPAASMSASIGPPPEKAKTPAKPDKPKDVPLDLFAPPDAQDAQLAVNIADDDVPRRKSEPVIPVPADAAAAATPAMRRSQPSLQTPAAPAGAATSSKLGPLADLRVRFAAGVVVAILVGFIPAHLVASMREGSYKDIDNKVIAAQQMADTPETYAQLDRLRADQLERKRGEQRNTAIIALAIWGLVGGAVAFGWFKKVPWERYE
jgi:hypothetical protein